MERHTHGTYAARRGQLGWESEAASLSMATAKGECKGECVTECIGPRCAPEGRTAAPGLRLPLWGRRAPGIRWAADPNTESRLNLAEPDMPEPPFKPWLRWLGRCSFSVWATVS
mmetsp:Transcript_61095/g.143862  ORF Transcript_61095/g.143862 Transcript_61095/m.143862 type:complete len:114 (+) Transcript_61095:157-498(+)